jgi:hypothetical protein
MTETDGGPGSGPHPGGGTVAGRPISAGARHTTQQLIEQHKQGKLSTEHLGSALHSVHKLDWGEAQTDGSQRMKNYDFRRLSTRDAPLRGR